MDEPAKNQPARPRIVFFGTPAFAVPALHALARDGSADVALVVTQPDRRAGRRQHLLAPPVKVAAAQLGISVLQPATLRDHAVQERLAGVGADLFIVAAFGRIFGARTLAIPRLGCLNLHASLLPAYRGASPIAAAIIEGDDLTGVSLMKMEAGLDTGPVLASNTEEISVSDTTESLTERLALRAAELIHENMGRYVSGDLVAEPQQGIATATRPLDKEDGRLDWSAPAASLERRIRAMWPWPRAWTSVPADGRNQTMQVHAAGVLRVADPNTLPLLPGLIFMSGGAVAVRCGTDALRLDLVQLAGGRPRAFIDLVQSRGLAGVRLDPEGGSGLQGEPLVRHIAEEC